MPVPRPLSARPAAPPHRLRPHRDDVLIAAAGLLGGLVMWSLDLYTVGPPREDPGWRPLVPLVVMTAAELLRRTAQPWALLPATAALVADQLSGSLLPTVLMFTDVVYAAVLYGSRRTARRVPQAGMLVTVASTAVSFAVWQQAEALVVGVLCGLLTVGPAWTGVLIRDHRDAAAAERLRAEQTALLAEMDRRQAVGAERARMARELHDVVANHLSAIAIHSTAALSLYGSGGEDGDPARSSLETIRGSSVQGLAEMRRLIGLLRDSEGDREPSAAPTLAGLDALVEQARSAGAADGLEFRLHNGAPDDGDVPAPVALAAYRIVQESLTNALKHAAPGPVEVRVEPQDGSLAVTVRSAFRPDPGARAPGAGAGLVGMRERAVLLGGVFGAGPLPGPLPGARTDGTGTGTWQVRAVLPLTNEEAP
ncbi:histidine kinase [Streptomyces sp. SCUT-3]|uniref:sensor histidine kinase n=1 Tax=Streptomyces sp. SCUT-3 TaxID=2684469 RepID=UPI002174DF31|nr:histidine kinase [Streptomyces sp. SCUT-3]